MNHRYFFMAPLLNRLGQPEFFCRLMAVALRVAAALIVLLSLTVVFKVGKITFELPQNRVLGGILFELFFIVAVYAAVHAFLIRARDIEQIKGLESYSISVLMLMLRLAGEAYFAFVALLSIGGGVFVWFTNQSLDKALGPLVRALFPGVADDSTFMGGIELMASGMLMGLGVLIVCYAAAQALALLVRPPVRNGNLQPAEISQPYRSRFGS